MKIIKTCTPTIEMKCETSTEYCCRQMQAMLLNHEGQVGSTSPTLRLNLYKHPQGTYPYGNYSTITVNYCPFCGEKVIYEEVVKA